MEQFLFKFFNFISFFGGELFVIIIATLVSIIVLFVYHKKRLSSFIFSNYATTLLSVILIKLIVQKPRNPLALVQENSYAFPSGHTALAMITYLLLLYLARFVKNKFWKNFMKIFGVFWLIATVAARLYLKVHDWTDIIASLIIANFVFLIFLKVRIYRKDLLAKEFKKNK